MGKDSDDLVSLPSPPPPRPAARRAAIDAALRRFDGIEEAPAQREPRRRLGWATMHRRPAGALVAAALVAVVFIPAVPIILRDNPPGVVPQAEVPSQVQPSRDASICAGADCADQAASEPGPAPPDQAVVAAAPPSLAQPLALPDAEAEDRLELASAARERKAAVEAPAPVLMAPAPPPPPPPPAEPEAERDQNIVVTGTLIRAPNVAKQSRADQVGYAATPASPLTTTDRYGEFLSRLQAGMKANDRRAIIALIGFPLRVNFDGRTQTYRSPRDVERDFDRIFTPQVRSEVSNLQPDELMSRDGGRLKGKGRLWFGCSKRSCSSGDTIHIREVNP